MKRRRRKKPNRPANEAQQLAPLQPAYPEDREAAEPEDQTGADLAPEPPPTQTAQPGSEPQQRKKRRRGGRGRSKSRGLPAPPVVEPGAVEVPSDEAPAGPETADIPVASVAAQQAHAGKPKHRQPKGTVVLTIGLPGSGKTSWFRRRGVAPLSSDLLRMMLFDDIGEQRYQDLVFSTLRYLLRARMIAHMPWNYVDATNLSPRERRGWIKMAQEFGYEVQAVFFDVPVEVCMDRNQRRGRIVPEDVMQRMAQKLRPPTFDEGFSKITVVRVKKTSKAEPDNEVQAEDEAGASKEPEASEES